MDGDRFHDFHDWWSERARANRFEVTGIPFSQLSGWRFVAESGNLAHVSGRFFSVEGLHVEADGLGSWHQPVLNQPEIGILGILVRDVGGVPHALMQAKMEPGNVNNLQLSPTVQATRSNHTRAHRGSNTRYLEYFRRPGPGRTLLDTLQSEHGAWFWQKRNRNMVVQVTGDVPVHDDYRWLPLRQVHRLLKVDNLVNMDTRSVLACLPPSAVGEHVQPPADPFTAALHRSYTGLRPGLHAMGEVLSWFTEAKTRCEWTARPIPLAHVRDWSRTDDEIADDGGERFRIVAVRVRADSREVSNWTQPLLAPRGQGLAAFLVRPFDGVLHVLVRARSEPGLLELVEMGPTVRLPAAGGPASEPYAGEAAAAPSGRVRFDAVLSEEGGRFHHALTRYRVIEVADDFPADVPDDFLWLTVHQLMRLVRHGRYLNVEARSLLACLHGLRDGLPSE
ncbi:MAG TPA: NDP-hexose 2,3-dehydratase family protein [Micromonosporaceae bacterium]|nr:NDP-hexose 2,3-dehydratase family protein [Micromonosporaceae bacterium]